MTRDIRPLLQSVWRILRTFTVLTFVATFLAFFGRWYWVFELACHFRVQYVWILTGSAILLLAQKKFMFCAIVMTAVLANLTVIAPLYFIATDVRDSDQVLRILSLNVHTQNDQYEKVLQLVRRIDPDFILLLEVNRRWIDAVDELKSRYKYSHVVPREDNFGITLYGRFPMVQPNVKRLVGSEIPVIVARFDVDHQPLTIIGAHVVPPIGDVLADHRNDQLANVAAIARSQENPVVLIGDLNSTSWSPFFRDLMRDSGLCDSRRGLGIQSSWPSGQPILRIPIDHCLVSPEIKVHDRRLQSNAGSDHFSIVVDFSIPRP